MAWRGVFPCDSLEASGNCSLDEKICPDSVAYIQFDRRTKNVKLVTDSFQPTSFEEG
jgi:hypothetical protein